MNDINPISTPRRIGALAALFLSGFAGLCYEIAWIRTAGLHFGATSFALGTVLALFFGGLALGSWIFGRVSTKLGRPMVAYGAIEIGVGLLGLLTIPLFAAADALFGMVYPVLSGNFPLLLSGRALLITIVILPPATLMGGALPLFARRFVHSRGRIAGDVGRLYGINTAGAVAGCAAAGFLLIPRFGITGTIVAAAAVNLLIGAWMITSWRAIPDTARRESAPSGRAMAGALPSAGGRVIALHTLFFLTGFIALANEVIWTRYFALVVRNTVYTYTITLLVVLVGIGLGSLLAGRPVDRMKNRAFLFGLFQIVGALSMVAALYALPRWANLSFHDADIASTVFLFGTVMLLPSLLSGASFPLAIRMVLDDPRFAGRRVGTMTALNTAGGIGGALLSGFLLLPALGLARAIAISSALALVTGFIAWFALAGRGAHRGTIAIAAVALFCWFALPHTFGTRIPEDFLGRNGELIDFTEGNESNLAIVRTPAGLTLEIDRLWQGMDRKTAQIMAAHLPMALHPGAVKVAGIGIGTGQTFSRFLLYDRVVSLHCVDIEGSLPGLIREHYESAWLDDPRLQLIVEDGRCFLAHTREKFDIISLELGQTFRPGIAVFYTGEFYRIARRRLEEGGMICQFVPVGIVGIDELRGMIRTFLEVFPQSSLWFNRNELILVGTTAGDLRVRYSDVAASLSTPSIREDLEYAYWGGPAHWLKRPEVFLGGFLAGPTALARLAAGGEIYGDDRPALEYATSRFRGAPEERIARELFRHREGIKAILIDSPEGAVPAAAALTQERNIGDIMASSLLRESGRAISAGAVREAGKILEAALTWNGANRKAHNNLGLVAAQNGDGGGAIRHFTDAVTIDPAFAEARFNLARSLAGAGRTDEAADHLAEVIRLRPDWEHARNLLLEIGPSGSD